MEPGKVKKVDGEYKREGTFSIFIFNEPPGGRRYAEAFKRRTKKDRAHRVKWVLDNQYPDTEKVVLVTDNLNTHTISSLYRKKRFACHGGCRYTTRLNMEVGLILLKLNCRRWRHSVWATVGFQV